MSGKEILIIGAGLAGVATAWQLHQRGHTVTVMDARDQAAMETSFANAGALTPSQPEPWNAPGVHMELAKSLLGQHSAMKLNWLALPGLIGWGLRFLAHSGRKPYTAATQANFALSRYSIDETRKARDTLGLAFDNLCNGTLKLCRDTASLEATIRAAKTLGEQGLSYEVLDRDGLIAAEPQLAPIADQLVGAVRFPDDESGDAHAFTQALAREAEAAGVRFEWNTRIDALMDRAGKIVGVYTSEEEIEVDTIVLAGGHAAWRLLAPHGLHLPVRPVKGYSLTLDMSGLNDRPHIPVVDESLHTMITPMGGRLRVAGTAEITGENTDLIPARIENLKHLLGELYPELAERLLTADIQPWAGLRPVSADGRPFIGETRAPGLWLNVGHGHLGWTQAMGSGALLADLITGNETAIDPSPYAATRF